MNSSLRLRGSGRFSRTLPGTAWRERNSMSQFTNPPARGTQRPPKRERAGVRPAVLLLLLAIGIGASAILYWRAARTGPGNAAATAEPALSEATKAALRNLSEPVELRFHALLDPATMTNELPAFAARVDTLLSAYEREAAGRITVTRKTTLSPEAANAASQDGLKAFSVDNGEPGFLGIAVVQKTRKESLARLAPEWEAALESDLTRAIVRVGNVPPPVSPSSEKARTEEEALQAVKQAIPDPAAVTPEEGNRRLRELAMKEFQETTREMSAQVEEARQKLQQAMSGAPAAEQQAARKQLLETQAAGSKKLQQIAADAQARILAWQKLKGVSVPPPSGHGHPPVSVPGR
jgi:hypothetical protein